MQAEKVDFVLTYKIDRITRSPKEYNQVRPHSALDYRLPAPETINSLTLTQKVVLFDKRGHRNR